MQSYSTKWHHPDCTAYSPTADTYYIHGHVCTHELFVNHSYQAVVGKQFVYAHHPMMNNSDYDLVCEDLGYQLPRQYYTPIADMTASQLFLQFTQLHWHHRPWELAHWDTSDKQIHKHANYCWSVFVWQTCFPHIEESRVRRAIEFGYARSG